MYKRQQLAGPAVVAGASSTSGVLHTPSQHTVMVAAATRSASGGAMSRLMPTRVAISVQTWPPASTALPQAVSATRAADSGTNGRSVEVW